MVTLKTYNSTQLAALIVSPEFHAYPFKPISHHRAISQIHNPRAHAEDTLLILAFLDEQLAGYIGILPDDILCKESTIHFGWLSTLYIDPSFRGQRIGQLLLARACDEYAGHILLTEFTPEAEALYHKSQFFDTLPPLQGQVFHYLFNLNKILPAKNPKWKRLQYILRGVDIMSNFFLSPFSKIKSPAVSNYQVSNKLDDEAKNFIATQDTSSDLQRGLPEVAWLLSYPWILPGSKDPSYLFSDFENSYDISILKIYAGSRLENILIISTKNTTSKLLFCFGVVNDNTSSALHHFIIQKSISSLLSYEKTLNDKLQNMYHIFQKPRQRRFLMHKDMRVSLGTESHLSISGADSDAIFT